MQPLSALKKTVSVGYRVIKQAKLLILFMLEYEHVRYPGYSRYAIIKLRELKYKESPAISGSGKSSKSSSFQSPLVPEVQKGMGVFFTWLRLLVELFLFFNLTRGFMHLLWLAGTLNCLKE